ncbi:MAG: hypothetical protein H6898_10745 [Rhodobacter sp.]|nr:hypothetical protein [Paracoccaceae bacterium]MCC0077044.1 hypothetical protein [Rhodobacter sp.]
MLHAPDLQHQQPAPLFGFDGRSELPAAFRGSVLLLGSFDGFHRGHRALLERGRTLARASGRPLAVLQLDPHPQVLFRGATRFRLVTGIARTLLLGQCGFDFLYTPRFDAAYAALPPGAFARTVLCDRLGVGAVVTGPDFRFGHKRLGDVDMLRALGRRFGFAVDTIDEVRDGTQRISSSLIREAITRGDLARVARLLGRDWLVGIARDAQGRWSFDAEQLLPPAGDWPVEACDAAGGGLVRTTLSLGACGDVSRFAAPSSCRMLRWLA